MTPPGIRSNTDLTIIFNTDHGRSMEEYWMSFAGKMDKHAFFWLLRTYVEKVPHGFLAIVNDPNVPAEEKYFFGLADEEEVGLDTIMGCREFWMGSEKQLEDIMSGKMAEKREKISNLSKPDDEEGNLENENGDDKFGGKPGGGGSGPPPGKAAVGTRPSFQNLSHR